MTPHCKVQFFNDGIDYRLKDKKRRKSWIIKAITQEEKIPGTINVIFCDDANLLHLNRKYLNHNYYTDIISFNNSEDKQRIEGDIYISIERIKENAKKFSVTFEDEIDRIIVHGILHLIGYTDKDLKDKEIMTKKENFYLALRY